MSSSAGLFDPRSALTAWRKSGQLRYRRNLVGRVASLLELSFATFRGFVRLTLAELEFVGGRLQPFVEIRPEAVHRLVFVCLGNINRSAFAHAVSAGLGARTASIGLSTTSGSPAFEKAIATAPVYGYSLTSHRATDFHDYTYQPGDLLLAMEVRHARELVGRGIPADAVALPRPLGAPSSHSHPRPSRTRRPVFPDLLRDHPLGGGEPRRRSATGKQPMPRKMNVHLMLRHRGLVWGLERP